MTAIEKQTIKALAENDLKISPTARCLRCGVSTLTARIQKLKERTGLDATKFYDLVKLLNIADDEIFKC